MTVRAPDYRDRGPGFRKTSDIPAAEQKEAEQRRQAKAVLYRPSGEVLPIKPGAAGPLAVNDLPDLEACEQVMIKGFQDVARAIARIREGRLYTEAGYATFDDYCEQRMGITRRRGDQLAVAHFTMASLPEQLRTIVRNEANARAITAVPEEHRVKVLTRVARSGHVTAKAIREAAQPPVIDVEPERQQPLITTPLNPPLATAGGATLRPEHIERQLATVREPVQSQPTETNPMLDVFGPRRKPCPTCRGCGTIPEEGES